MPFAVAARDGVLTLTLDTPGSPVNVFNRATAEQLIALLADVRPETTRAIVFETAKSGSFINGVGLLLAHATQTHDDVVRASRLPWQAYRTVRDAPVPTIAVVQGNCFGCGVEFALCCDYRVAVDTAETRFYMTELNDYLFLPLFGSTWNLPEAVGLGGAVDLLLWGERWSARAAWERGLVDEVVPHAERATDTARFLARVLRGERPSRRRGRVAWGAAEDAIVARTHARIATLPADYRPVYEDGLALLEAGARQTTTFAAHQEHELARSAASALAPIGKAAYGFFYLRQVASERAAGRRRGGAEPLTLAIDVEAGISARPLADRLAREAVAGLTVDDTPHALCRLVGAPARRAANGGPPAVTMRVTPAPGPEGDVEVYAPGYPARGRLVELATRAGTPGLDADGTARLAATLQRFGFEVARTTPGGTFVTNRLLGAFLAPLVAFVERGGNVAALNAALRVAGFVRLPDALLGALDRTALAHALAPTLGCAPSSLAPALEALARPSCADDAGAPIVVDALCLTLLEAVLAARAGAAVRDPSITDLITRELLDFPRHLVSLATWLKIARVTRALEVPEAAALVSASVRAAAHGFVAAGRELYR